MSTIPFIGASGPLDEVDDGVDRDTWTTPPWLTRAIGPVWMDPCSNERSTVDARMTFQLARGQDALVLARYVPRRPPGLVFINPPYSRGQVIRFVRAFVHTRFMFLLRHDVSTMWFRELYAATSVILQPWQRVNFIAPPGLAHKTHNNPFPHSLFVRDERDVSRELRELCAVIRPERTAA